MTAISTKIHCTQYPVPVSGKRKRMLKWRLRAFTVDCKATFFGHRRTQLDGYSDNSYDRHQQIGFQNPSVGIINPSNVPTSLYNDPYAGIAACNYFLENVGSVTVMPEATRDLYVAEVRFLRALFYSSSCNFLAMWYCIK
jgi:hypothetical protein